MSKLIDVSSSSKMSVQLARNDKKGVIVLEYSSPCKWVEMTGPEAREFATVLLKYAADLEMAKAGATVR